MDPDSLGECIARMNEGDAEAVGRVFRAYEPYLRIAVRRHLSPRLRTKVGSEDIVQSVFADLFRGVRDGGWHFAGREQMLGLLRKIARRRLADRYQKHGPALERELPLDDAPPGSLPRASQPRASQEAQGREAWEAVLRACPPAHREVVRMRGNGYRIGEIADRTGLHEGSVRRILYDLARRLSMAQQPPPAGDRNPGGRHGARG